ncbi:MAG TPA: oligopeptidase A [Psychromonas hadalis]|nr:oligopeptidase A [Psychromonas hadalis]
MTTLAINKTNGLPLFSQITADTIVPAVTAAIAKSKALIEEKVATIEHPTWDNFIAPLDEDDDNLSKLWSPIAHMNAVVSSDEWREAHDTCLPLFAEFGTFVGQHKGLYEAYLSISKSSEFETLQGDQQKVITDALQGFELAGITLAPDDQARFGEISQQLAKLQSQFSNNVLDATHAWSKLISDIADLDGLPESALAAAKQAAQEAEKEGYLLTLDIPSYLPVMTYAKSSELRKEVYTAFATRASDQGPNAGEFDNTKIIEDILALRHEKVRLLGFENYAQYSLATKMAETPHQVIHFLTELSEKSLPQAKQEMQEVTDFANEIDGVSDLNTWDLSYYAERLKQEKYSISDEILRSYFPENQVLNGLFTVVNKLFNVTVKEVTEFDTWHSDVRFFNVLDENNQHIASFYFDLYAREGKRGGAWMDDCRVRCRQLNGELQLPVAYLTCNFTKPIGDKPAQFTHDEVVTMFHEFGHGLHHMFTKIESSGVSGINGVPWDAVELPSQFLENWCWEPQALAFISGHIETGEPLPSELLDKMLAAKNYNSALAMARQIEFSLFDFKLHHAYQAGVKDQVSTTLNSVREQVSVTMPPAFNRFQNSFSHIFAGGYAAGYYSYKWAEVLSADAFSKFEIDGVFNAQTGQAFKQAILEKGGSEAPMQLFKAFMGREPTTEALLRHCGIK